MQVNQTNNIRQMQVTHLKQLVPYYFPSNKQFQPQEGKGLKKTPKH